MVEMGIPLEAVVKSKYVLAAGLVSLPLTLQITVGLAAVMSSWDILVFAWAIIVPSLQLLSGALFLPVLIMSWKGIFYEAGQEDKIKAVYYGVVGLFVLNAATAVVSIFLIAILPFRRIGDEIKILIRNYSLKISDKKFLDDIQMRFHCCGGSDVTNWFYHDWENVDIEPGHVVDISLPGWDAVPFSCCTSEAPPPCHHEGLKTFGLGSLYKTSCANALTLAMGTYLTVCTVMAVMTVVPLGWLMMRLRKEQDVKKIEPKMGDQPPSTPRRNRTPLPEKPLKEKLKLNASRKKLQIKDLTKSKKKIPSPRSHQSSRKWGQDEESSGSFEEIYASSQTSSEELMPSNGRGDCQRTLSDTAVASLKVPQPLLHTIPPTYCKF